LGVYNIFQINKRAIETPPFLSSVKLYDEWELKDKIHRKPFLKARNRLPYSHSSYWCNTSVQDWGEKSFPTMGL
jgi:hypothetical protein